MNILVTAAELYPFAKAGGLADITYALAKAWAKMGHRVRIVIPKYQMINAAAYGLKPTRHVIGVPMGSWTEYARLWSGVLPGSSVPVTFLENAEYYERPGIYGAPEEFGDNDRRFLFLSRAVFEVARALNFLPEVIFANDFHTAMTMPFLKIHYRRSPYFQGTAGVLSIHNIAFQGIYDPDRFLFLAQIPKSFFYPTSPFEFYGKVNVLKAGILFADKITTVSPRYAYEIRTTSLGMGLQAVLQQRAADLVGILNGVDYTEWNPETDEKIYFRYTPETLHLKRQNKLQYLKDHHLPDREVIEDIPLVGMVTRLTDQKGIPLLREALESLITSLPLRFTLLGSGAWQYEEFFRYMARRYPTRVLVHIGYNEELSHKVIAASDIYLMPSLYEPCGLTQMYALKYGTPPVVRFTGGLADTVREFSPETAEGTGFVFHRYDAGEMSWAVQRAVQLYYVKPLWEKLMQNAMREDFSVEKSAQRYIEVFQWALDQKSAQQVG